MPASLFGRTRVVVYFVSYRVQLADSEGVVPKWWMDCLHTAAGVITDDDARYVAGTVIIQVKVKTFAEERTEILVKPESLAGSRAEER